MQFNQPTAFQTPGFTNYGQPYGFNNPSPFQLNGYPDIIGEGNVTSIISPDGSSQLLFMPTAQWWRSCPQNPGNFNNPYINYSGAWFVRNIYNPIQPTVFSPPNQATYGVQYPRTSTSDCGLNLPAPAFPLKFHNDNCTSTSDIHYFLPKQYNWFQNPTGCASVQVGVPLLTVCHHEVLCTKPCNCTPIEPCSCAKKVISKQIIQCMCNKLKTNNSEMSVEEAKSDLDCQKQNITKSRGLKRIKSKKSSHAKCNWKTRTASEKSVTMYTDKKNTLKTRKLSITPSYSNCECKEQTALDKSVTTYTDQATGCTPEKGQETQTAGNDSILKLKVIKGGFNKWGDTTTNKNDLESKSHSTLEQCESRCVGRTCSTCSSATDD